MIYVCREISTHMSERGVMRRQNFCGRDAEYICTHFKYMMTRQNTQLVTEIATQA